jgi:hypothetical protein
MVILSPHATKQARKRGATAREVGLTVQRGKPSLAKKNRTRFRQAFPFNSTRAGKFYAVKQIDAFAELRGNNWYVFTVIVKYY